MGGQNAPLEELTRGPACDLPICHTGGVGWRLIQVRGLAIAPGGCLATAVQCSVYNFSVLEGAGGGSETHPCQPLRVP